MTTAISHCCHPIRHCRLWLTTAISHQQSHTFPITVFDCHHSSTPLRQWPPLTIQQWGGPQSAIAANDHHQPLPKTTPISHSPLPQHWHLPLVVQPSAITTVDCNRHLLVCNLLSPTTFTVEKKCQVDGVRVMVNCEFWPSFCVQVSGVRCSTLEADDNGGWQQRRWRWRWLGRRWWLQQMQTTAADNACNFCFWWQGDNGGVGGGSGDGGWSFASFTYPYFNLSTAFSLSVGAGNNWEVCALLLWYHTP